MAKKTIKETNLTENKEVKPELKTISGLSINDLVKQLKDKEQLKTVIENQYHQLCGQIQLLMQMISALQEKDKN